MSKDEWRTVARAAKRVASVAALVAVIAGFMGGA